MRAAATDREAQALHTAAPVRQTISGWLVASAAALAAAGCEATDLSGRQEPVVGGQAESGYPAAGWLTATTPGAPFPMGEACGAALIGRDVVVTAGHCIALEPPDRVFGFSTGAVGSAPVVPVASVHLHPLYDPDAPYPERQHHDLAVLRLAAPVASAEPARIGLAVRDPGAGGAEPDACSPGAIYIGYGRTTVGGPDVEEGYTSERKSALQCVEAVDPLSIFTAGVGGGLCWGDSGGALMRRDSDEVLGVLSDFDDFHFSCDVGNPMVFTDLAEHLDFICSIAPDADACCAAGDCCAADGTCNAACASDPDCPDASGPEVVITEPADGAAVAIGATIAADIRDPSGVARAELVVGGQVVATRTGSPWTFSVPVGTAAGAVDLEVRAYDAPGNLGAAAVSVTVRGLALGAACEGDVECDSRLCGEAGGERRCTVRCDQPDACPDGFECRGGAACWPEDGGGCRTGSRGGGAIGAALTGLFALVARRRQRAPSKPRKRGSNAPSA